MIPHRLRKGLISGNWISALNTFRNKSDTLKDMRERTEKGLDELILLAQKMPREELIKVIPREKIEQLIHSYLTIDPDEEQLLFEQNQQYEIVKTMNETKEMRVLTQKRNQAISKAKAKASRRGKSKITLSHEELIKIEKDTESKVLTQRQRDRLNVYRNEEDKWKALGEKHSAYRLSALGERTKLASALAVEGTQFCLEQVSVVLEPEITDLVSRSFMEATKLLKFVPDKVANSKITVEDITRAGQRNLEAAILSHH